MNDSDISRKIAKNKPIHATKATTTTSEQYIITLNQKIFLYSAAKYIVFHIVSPLASTPERDESGYYDFHKFSNRITVYSTLIFILLA